MTRVVSAIIVAALALPALSACQKSAATGDTAAASAAIRAVEDGMRAAYAAKDPAKLASFYAEKGTLYVPHERARVGAAAIIAGAQKEAADPAFSITFTTGMVAVAASGETGYSKGSFTVRYTDPKTRAPGGYSGYYLTIFGKQADGSWKVTEDMAVPAD